jgi:DNA polymerase elongation subunit (family B)
MDWLDIESDENQDMHHEFIGSLVMRDGFKVRYKEVELYTDELRQLFIRVFREHGYDVSIKYNNTFAYCEVTAVRKENRYGDVAMGVAIVWAIYRVYVYMTHV